MKYSKNVKIIDKNEYNNANKLLELHKSISSNPALEERICLSISFTDVIPKRTDEIDHFPHVKREKKDIYIKYNPQPIAPTGTLTKNVIIKRKINFNNVNTHPPGLMNEIILLISEIGLPDDLSVNIEWKNKINTIKTIKLISILPVGFVNNLTKKFLNDIAKFLVQYRQTKYNSKKLQVPLRNPDVLGTIFNNIQSNISGNQKANSNIYKKVPINAPGLPFSSLLLFLT